MHPPLLKIIAAVPLQVLPIRIPENVMVPETIERGKLQVSFFYESGVQPRLIVFLSRCSVIFLNLTAGLIFYFWLRRSRGREVALLSTFFLVTGITVVAHSRYVATDVPAAIGYFWGVIASVSFIEAPSKKRFCCALCAVTFSLLIKFSTLVLIPLLFVFVLVRASLYSKSSSVHDGTPQWKLAQALSGVCLLVIFSILIVALVYEICIRNTPYEIRYSYLRLLSGIAPPVVIRFMESLLDVPVFRGLQWFLAGALRISDYVLTGVSLESMAPVEHKHWDKRFFFPSIYLVKESFSSLFLLLLAVLMFLRKQLNRIMQFRIFPDGAIFGDYSAFCLVCAFSVYLFLSVSSQLTLGIRHIIPLYPFIALFVGTMLGPVFRGRFRWKFMQVLVAAGIAAQAAMIPAVWPYYTSFYNPANSYLRIPYSEYGFQSDFNWGQDVFRLRDKCDELKYSMYYVDNPKAGWALGRRGIFFSDADFRPPSGSIFVASLSMYEGKPTPFNPTSRKKYTWLEGMEPFAEAGTTFRLYKIP